MKNTEIPNGFVIAGPDGKPILIRFNEDGKAMEGGYELELTTDWVPDTHPNGIFLEDVLVLVHYIEGDKYLVKALEINKLLNNGEPTSVFYLADMKLLQKTAEGIRDRYLEGKEAKPNE